MLLFKVWPVVSHSCKDRAAYTPPLLKGADNTGEALLMPFRVRFGHPLALPLSFLPLLPWWLLIEANRPFFIVSVLSDISAAWVSSCPPLWCPVRSSICWGCHSYPYTGAPLSHHLRLFLPLLPLGYTATL